MCCLVPKVAWGSVYLRSENMPLMPAAGNSVPSSLSFLFLINKHVFNLRLCEVCHRLLGWPRPAPWKL